MSNSNQSAYARAILDFNNARREADLQNFLAWLTGKNTRLLSYEEVRQKLRASANTGSPQILQDIPLDAIVGSVGRYTDFNRDFLPQREGIQDRWARVMVQAVGQTGLPPIDVYKIGDAYFVLDGNHRVSVARQLGNTYIQARVTEVKTDVPITPDLHPDELIIKAEYAEFLEKTQLHKLRPDSDLILTAPGRYRVLLEHIAVHQYLMGIDEDREIPYAEAVAHWYDTVYLPVVEMLRERNILRHFPGRTEGDLYIWLAKHRDKLRASLGWEMDMETTADNLVERYASGLSQTIERATARILDAVTPDGLDAGPPTGAWRQQHQMTESQTLFRNILVGISRDDTDWQALQQAILYTQKENAILRGLHVVPTQEMLDAPETAALVETFQQRCAEAGVHGDIAIEVGSAAQRICDRARWADLIIGKLTYPPADQPLARLSSGFRIMVRRCSRPILAVPGNATPVKRALLAYNGSPKSEEALFIASYMASKWQLPLTVLTIKREDMHAEEVQARAQAYLSAAGAAAEYYIESGEVVPTVLEAAHARGCDFILIGGYRATPLVEIIKGSFVDEMLRETDLPTLICR